MSCSELTHSDLIARSRRRRRSFIIGFASEANDKEAKVRAFVAKHGAKLGYTFAIGSGTETQAAYMKGSGQNGIPCSFVVDKQGRIAYIGHPVFLDFVLPKVLDGTWDPKTGTERLAAADKDFDAAYAVMNLLEVYAFAGDETKVKEFGPKAVAAAKAALQGENDAIGTLTVAAAYFASGDKAQAKSAAEKAIKMVDPKNLGLRRYVEQRAEKYCPKP